MATLYFTLSALFGYSFSQGLLNRNVSVDTTVNITNAIPEVLFVQIESGALNITLNPGTTKAITCNATVRDWNGGSTVVNVTAIFYHNSSSNGATDDGNDHYTNSSCFLGNFDNYTRNVTCTFPVWYYANMGNWTCNVTAFDGNVTFNESVQNYSRSNFNRTNIDALLALNVTPLIDYGNLSVGDTSDPQQGNITNLGNRNINISIRGFSNTSYLPNGLGLVCDIGNITVQNEKYNIIGGTNPATYINLSNVSTSIGNLTVLQQTNDSQQVINTTYWVLYVPPNPFGRCNGTIVFQAEKAA
jgi:hypothetical protein